MKMQESSITSLIAAFSRAHHSQFDSPKIFDEIANNWLDLDTISSVHTDLGGF